ncbi:MAG TPA: threonine ammonia-lyase [Candidatus Binatia bacterium]|jgi:threonine dehydratase
MITVQDIAAARAKIKEQVYLSPCVYSETISRIAQNRVFFKLENLQITGSFKERGALNRLLALSPEEARRGVIAASAGNHGMAVAFHSRRLGIPATIVMPTHAPLIKAASVRGSGARTILYGADYDAALAEARRIGREEGLTLIHSFDDPWVIAGQGTLGLELHEQNPDLDIVAVPVGGGGLIAGVALALKERKPEMRIVGVQAERIPSMKAALETGKPVRVPQGTTIADGIAVRAVGELPLQLAGKYVDQIVTVSEGEIANAVLLLLEIEKTVAEGAAAVSLAALVNGKIESKGKSVALIISGGNIDMNLISRIIEKGLIQDGRVIRLSVVVPDRPGYLAALAQCIAKEEGNILQIEHVRGFGEISVGETEIELILETTGHDHARRIHESLEKQGFHVRLRSG